MTKAKIEMFDPKGKLVYTSYTRLEKSDDTNIMFNYNIDVFKVLHVTDFSLIFDPEHRLFSVVKYYPVEKFGNVVPVTNTIHQVDPNPDLFEFYVLHDVITGRCTVQATRPFVDQNIRELRVTIET